MRNQMADERQQEYPENYVNHQHRVNANSKVYYTKDPNSYNNQDK